MVKKIREDYNEELFLKLQKLRDKIAETKGVTGFIVFSDPVLREFAYYFPTDKETCLLIKGVGEKKFDTYGKKFIDIIKEFSKDLPEVPLRHEELKSSAKPVKPKINVKERTEMRKTRVKELILEKKCIDDIAVDLELTNQTITNYIAKLLAEDPELDVQYIKDSIEGYKDIVKSYEKHGMEKMGPVYADFGGNVEFTDIALVRVLMNKK